MAHANEPLACAERSNSPQAGDPFSATRRRERPSFPLDILAVIFAGGCVGGYARYAITEAWTASRSTFPSAILTINLMGAFLLALLVVLAAELLPSRYLRPLLGTGFCGALTTFSSVMVGAAGIYARHRPAVATGYLVATVIGGIAAALLGRGAGRAITRFARHASGRSVM